VPAQGNQAITKKTKNQSHEVHHALEPIFILIL